MNDLKEDCKKDQYNWGPVEPVRERALWSRDRLRIQAGRPESGICDSWAYRVRSQYERPRLLLRVFRWHHRSRHETTELERKFHEHAEKWKSETRHSSSIIKMISHPSYLRIIGLAATAKKGDVERLLIQELQTEPDHWFAALTAITGIDPIEPQHDFDQAVTAWVEWGRREGLI